MRRSALLLALCLLGPGQSACTDSCEDVGCGPGGVSVSWGGQVPVEADRYRICVDERCVPAEPSGFADDQGQGEPILVGGSHTPDGPVDVRFDAVAPDGTLAASYRGTGERTSGCCAAVFMRVAGPGRLVPDDPDD